MSIYCEIDEFTIEDQLFDMFIDQLHKFAEEYEDLNSPSATSDFHWWSSSSAD